jgi:hypothetical protein
MVLEVITREHGLMQMASSGPLRLRSPFQVAVCSPIAIRLTLAPVPLLLEFVTSQMISSQG